MSQAQIAREMTRVGYRMHQTAIAKIERGERPLRLNEAAMLAHVLHTDLATALTEVDDGTGTGASAASARYFSQRIASLTWDSAELLKSVQQQLERLEEVNQELERDRDHDEHPETP